MINFCEIIMLKYPYNGGMNTGIVRLNLRLNSHETETEFLSIEYGDQDIQSYVEKNPSVLEKINDIRNKYPNTLTIYQKEQLKRYQQAKAAIS